MGTSARVIAARALRGFADGALALVLPVHLTRLGWSPAEVGGFFAATLLGSALLTLAVGLVADRVHARSVLLAGCALMLATALGLLATQSMALLLVVAFLGTLNPGGGDVSVFLPTEQALLAHASAPGARAEQFALYNLGGALAGALGALASGAYPSAELAFAGYGLCAVLIAPLYLPPSEDTPRRDARRPPLLHSRRTVLELSALFSLDSFGGGFAVPSMVVLWLHRRFALSPETTGAVFFAAGLLGAFSQLISARLAQRLGLVRTMVFTHLPANLFLIAAALAPTPGIAIACLLARAALAQMDVPARQALVMALVPPEERAAAASVTNVPRSLATALAPLPAGALLGLSSLGWPLIAGGALKIAYDLWLFAAFRGREPPA